MVERLLKLVGASLEFVSQLDYRVQRLFPLDRLAAFTDETQIPTSFPACWRMNRASRARIRGHQDLASIRAAREIQPTP